jgi:hypothetical protein
MDGLISRMERAVECCCGSLGLAEKCHSILLLHIILSYTLNAS